MKTVTYELLDELFTLLEKIEPISKGKVWEFWLTADRGSVEDYGDYNEWLEVGEVDNYAEFEQSWKDEFPAETEWYCFRATYKEDIDYRAVFLHHEFVIEQDLRKERGYENDISAFVQWLVDGVKSVIDDLETGTYNASIQHDLPYQHKIGTVLHKHKWEIYPKQREAIIGNMTDKDIAYFLANAVSEVPNSFRLDNITANDFYRFCAVGYKACDYEKTDISPKKQYYRYADGRDEGLRDIDSDSPGEFNEWYSNAARFGGHHWGGAEVVTRPTSICLYTVMIRDGISFGGEYHF